MLHRSIIDGRPININEISGITVFQSPLFTGISRRPRLVVKMEDGRIRIVQPAPSGEATEQLEENQNWQKIDWVFKDEKDLRKHQKEDEENTKLYYVIGFTSQFDHTETFTGINLYILKKGSRRRCENYCYRHHKWWIKLDFYLANWQIPLFTIVGALIGAGVSVVGNISLEIIKHYWFKE